MKYTKILLLFFGFIFLSNGANAQVFGGQQERYDPVSWGGEIEKISETEYVLHYDAKVEDGWHIYSHYSASGIPFTFEYLNMEKTLELMGTVKETETIKQY
ncbi:MAG: hypothetical protein ACI86L_001726, partial [Dokdonia sp.]